MEQVEPARNSVVKINYEELKIGLTFNGGKPFLHVHVFGRATNAIKQPFPDAVSLPDRSSGFYDGFEPLSDLDEKEILAVIRDLVQQPKYITKTWGLDN
jgi:hypothetical protein